MKEKNVDLYLLISLSNLFQNVNFVGYNYIATTLPFHKT